MKNLTQAIKKAYKTLLVVPLLSSAMIAVAEDAEVFYSVNTSKPNLLFVLDNSGSMNWDVDGNSPTLSNGNANPNFTAPSRLNIMKSAVNGVLSDTDISNVNIGVMRYGPGMNHESFISRYWNRGWRYYYSGESSTRDDTIRSHGINGVAFPVTDINAKVTDVIPTNADTYFLPSLDATKPNETVRSYTARIINGWQASGGTPIVGALYEAALYFRGEQMHWGQDNPNHLINNLTRLEPIAAHPSTYLNATQTSVISTNYLTKPGGNSVATWNTNTQVPRNHAIAPNYNSPIKSTCQSNYIVLMSDGQPTYYDRNLPSGSQDQMVSPLARVMRGDSSYSTLAANIPNCTGTGFRANAGRCGPELTKYIAENDMSIAYDDKQIIETFTIGFGAAMSTATQNYLQDLATFDDPDTPEGPRRDAYFSATNSAQLVSAFKKILSKIGKPSGSLASPGYSVNVKSGLEHEKDIYIPVFDRKNTSRWNGNLKKFSIVDTDGKRLIRGDNNKDAFDELGGFSDDALDFWSTSPDNNPDGAIVEKGGAASLLDDPSERKLFSNLTGNTNVALSAEDNLINKDNFEDLDNSVFGLPSGSSDSDYRKTLANFIRGWKDGVEDSAARRHMGDMLHSDPIVITYRNESSGISKKQYIFAGTNEGYLHAFDTSTGKEIFAFMPKELFKIIKPQFVNGGSEKDHKYGIDGSLTYWLDDKNNNGVVDGDDRVYLFFGLRRGGSSYYALDITDMNESDPKPRLLWTKSNADYPTMGQSWSIPYLGMVGTEDGPKAAVIISGGYDEDEDRNIGDGSLKVGNAKSLVEADVGNDILILDIEDHGNKLWSLSNSQTNEITSSIPGGVRILDTNYNKLIDRLYFADTGGNVWRVDLSEELGSSSAESTLVKLADLGDGQRKFYNEPDVAIMKLNGKTIYAVSIGSGFRAHPLDKTIVDKFFVLLDTSPFKPIDQDEYFAITTADGDGNGEKDLAVISISEAGINITDSIQGNKKRGWEINLVSTGEKVLATALTFDGVLTFTTLVPKVLTSGVGVDLCRAPATQGRLYAIDMLSGNAGMDLNEDGVITDEDAFLLISKGEIPGKPQSVVNALEVEDILDDQGVATGEKSCKHPVDIRIGKKLTQATGYDTCRLESVYWSDPVTNK